MKQLIAETARLGMPAVPLTDHGKVYWAANSQEGAKAVRVKPVIGMEAYVALTDRRQESAVFRGDPGESNACSTVSDHVVRMEAGGRGPICGDEDVSAVRDLGPAYGKLHVQSVCKPHATYADRQNRPTMPGKGNAAESHKD